MNEPGVSLDTLARLEEAEQDRAMEMIMRKRGFTGTELTYE
jgi:hypothetical protein